MENQSLKSERVCVPAVYPAILPSKYRAVQRQYRGRERAKCRLVREIEREYTEYKGSLLAMSTDTYQCWSLALSAAGVVVLAVYTFFTFRLFRQAQQQTA